MTVSLWRNANLLFPAWVMITDYPYQNYYNSGGGGRLELESACSVLGRIQINDRKNELHELQWVDWGAGSSEFVDCHVYLLPCFRKRLGAHLGTASMSTQVFQILLRKPSQPLRDRPALFSWVLLWEMPDPALPALAGRLVYQTRIRSKK